MVVSMSFRILPAALVCSLGLAACSGNDDGTTTTNTTAVVSASDSRGTLLENPPRRVASLDSAAALDLLLTLANGQSIRDAAGPLSCGIDFHRIEYWTVDSLKKPIAVSGVLMAPTGSAAVCNGARPIVVYAHGTSFDKSYNLASTSLSSAALTESLLMAAVFAARGYVVVAPNYVGYDKSNNVFHPYLIAEQSASDMIDALTASRKAFGKIQASGLSDSGKLFLTGYSQGGHVAMATHRAMQTAGQTVTASVPMSGPYAVAAFLDTVVRANVGFSSTFFMPMLTTSFQKTYGGLYTATADVFEDRYASGIEALLPSSSSTDDLVSQGKLPEKALFSDTTPVTGDASLDALLSKPTDRIYSQGFGNPNLVRNSFRVAVARDSVSNPDGAVSSPQRPAVPTATTTGHPFRTAAKTNDLRNWQPTNPVLLCGGNADPTVNFGINTTTMQTYWASLPAGRVTVLDIDKVTTTTDQAYASQRDGFASAKRNLERSGGQSSVDSSYHTTVAIYCSSVAREFFDRLR
ncbi:MAG: alpha/beta hydrolase [Betaproteobacteria bacterium]|nr:MAG: alpha/beta hydrolase [Betaproteobacteria bacterium]